MELKTTRKPTIVEEVPYGVYLWRCADGEYAGDDDGNVMNVYCLKSDRRAVDALIQAAKHYGVYEGGRLEWRTGARRVTDEELEEQVARFSAGLVADPWDLPAMIEEDKRRRKTGDGA